MSRAIKLFAVMTVILFIIGEIFAFKTGVMDKKIDSLTEQYTTLLKNNRELKVQYYSIQNLSRIDQLAREKLKMSEPSSFIVVRIHNAR